MNNQQDSGAVMETIDIDLASKADLMRIKDVGERKAENILAARDRNGGQLTRSQFQEERLTGGSVMQYIFANNLIRFSGEVSVYSGGAQFSQMGQLCSDNGPLAQSELQLAAVGTTANQVCSNTDYLTSMNRHQFQGAYDGEHSAGLIKTESDSDGRFASGDSGSEINSKDLFAILRDIRRSSKRTHKKLQILCESQDSTGEKVSMLSEAAGNLKVSVSAANDSNLKLAAMVTGLDERVTAVEGLHTRCDDLSEEAKAVESSVQGLFLSHDQFKCDMHKEVQGAYQEWRDGVKAVESRVADLQNKLGQQEGVSDSVRNHIVGLQSDLNQQDEKYHRDLRVVSESQDRLEEGRFNMERDQEQCSTRVASLELQQKQHRDEVTDLSVSLDCLQMQVRTVREEVDSLKKVPVVTQKDSGDLNPKVAVSTDPVYQAMERDLFTSFQELSKLVVENEAVLQRHEQTLREQEKQLEEMKRGSYGPCLADIEDAHQHVLNVQGQVFKAKRQPVLSKIGQQLQVMKDTFNIEYELSLNLHGFQWTGLDLKASDELSDGVATISKKNVTIAEPPAGLPKTSPYIPVPRSVQNSASHCSTPKDECIQRVTATIQHKIPDGVYCHSGPRVNVVTQKKSDDTSDNSSEEGDGEVLATGGSRSINIGNSSRTQNWDRGKKMHIPKLSFEGEHWNGFIAQFELVAKNCDWSGSEKIRNFAMSLKREAAEYYGILSNRRETDYDWLVKKFQGHFGKSESPSALRWELLQTEQRVDESLEKYLARLQKIC